MTGRPALFLDRDGVLNTDHGYVVRWEDFQWIEGARELIRRFNKAGWLVVVATNQAGVARGFYDEAAVDRLHRRINADLAGIGAHIDAFYYCPFHKDAVTEAYRIDDHADRKPNPGMLLRAAGDLEIDLARSLLVGDKESDLEAARRAGVASLHFLGGNLDDFVMSRFTQGQLLQPEIGTMTTTTVPDDTALLDLHACAAEAKDWLFNKAAPLWCSEGVLADGMFAEALSLSGRPVHKRRRVRVQARQIYAFCEIGRLGWAGPWRPAAEHALDRLLETGRREDGFFIHQFDEHGKPADMRADLYDHAFILFALAHAKRALERPDLMPLAHTLMDRIDARWKNAAGGYNEGEIAASPPRRQNPHMHLLEATLALHAVANGERWQTIAETLFTLFANAFFDRQCGALREYFGMDWHPIDNDLALIVEPGHCFEWAWLLHRLPAETNATSLADQLIAFARLHGIDNRRGVAINEVLLGGTVKDPTARLWPQTERLKAALARWGRIGDPEEARQAVAAYRGLTKYFDMPVAGTWRDRLLTDGTWVEEDAPASSFYHIVCALSDLIKSAAPHRD